MSVITLTTDFGHNDWFVGTMKGVIATINPSAKVIDITHGIPSGDIRAGAFALMAGYGYFPRKTIHVAVVDPGVGSKRGTVAIETTDHIFLGPDNGVLSWAVRGEEIKSIRSIENRKLALKEISSTFHGRDVFAPAAAHLSKGIKVSRVGSPRGDFQELAWPTPEYRDGALHGEVVYIDHFGNAITNIGTGELSGFNGVEIRTSVGRSVIEGRFQCYADGKPGRPEVLVSSSGLLEIAINRGSAAAQLKLRVGTPVRVEAQT